LTIEETGTLVTGGPGGIAGSVILGMTTDKNDTQLIVKGLLNTYFLEVGLGSSLIIDAPGTVISGMGSSRISGSPSGTSNIIVNGFWRCDNFNTSGANNELTVGTTGTLTSIYASIGRSLSSSGSYHNTTINGFWKTEHLNINSGTVTIGTSGTLITGGGGTTVSTNENTFLNIRGLWKANNSILLCGVTSIESSGNIQNTESINIWNGKLILVDNAIISAKTIEFLDISGEIIITSSNIRLTLPDGYTPLAIKSSSNHSDDVVLHKKVIFKHNGNMNFENAISGKDVEVRLESGTTILTEKNSYQLGTHIGNGAILIAANSGALGSGNVTVSAGGILDLFSSGTIGLLTVGGNLSSLGELRMTLTADGHADLLSVAGDLSISGTLGLDVLDVFDYSKQYQLFKDFHSLMVSDLNITGYDTANWSAELDGLGWLHFTAIPEPNTWVLMVTGLLMLVLIVRFLSPQMKKNNQQN
jgi:hypothetical protein